jgi:hypothetical protein
VTKGETVVFSFTFHVCRTWTGFGRSKNDVISERGSEGGWRKLHNDELHNLYSSLNTVTIISEKTRWVEHVKYTRERKK